ncbi:hypothetical protein CSE45_2034 [Citreicella sp. SE45]|nr:hypothetical protein CSE45_2034 [Citreicella sp. SE45]
MPLPVGPQSMIALSCGTGLPDDLNPLCKATLGHSPSTVGP